MKIKIFLIILLVFILPFLIIFSQNLFQANYLISSIYKIIFLTPILFRIYLEKKSLKESLKFNFSLNILKNNFFKMVLIGVGLFLIYISTFLFFENMVDLTVIASQLEMMAMINSKNIVLIGLYIIFFNSLLEEFFWRGFVFDELNKSFNRFFVYIFTGIAFSLHHIVFYYGWFNLFFSTIITLGLVVYAMIMNFIFNRYKDLFSCWLVHAIADAAQILIALRIFQII